MLISVLSQTTAVLDQGRSRGTISFMIDGASPDGLRTIYTSKRICKWRRNGQSSRFPICKTWTNTDCGSFELTGHLKVETSHDSRIRDPHFGFLISKLMRADFTAGFTTSNISINNIQTKVTAANAGFMTRRLHEFRMKLAATKNTQ